MRGLSVRFGLRGLVADNSACCFCVERGRRFVMRCICCGLDRFHFLLFVLGRFFFELAGLKLRLRSMRLGIELLDLLKLFAELVFLNLVGS